MSKVENKAQAKVVSAANYFAGREGGDVVAFKTTAQLAQFITLAAAAHGAAQEQAERLAGGVRGMALVALLVVSRVEKLGKGDAPGGSIREAKEWLRNHNVKLSESDASDANAWSEIGRIANTLAAWRPALPDVATATQEAMAMVREGLATHGSFQKWRDSAPKATKAGRKAGKGAGKSSKAKPEAVTAHEALKRLNNALRDCNVFLSRGDVETLDGLKLAHKRLADMLAAAPAADAKAKPVKRKKAA